MIDGHLYDLLYCVKWQNWKVTIFSFYRPTFENMDYFNSFCRNIFHLNSRPVLRIKGCNCARGIDSNIHVYEYCMNGSLDVIVINHITSD
jgi:hypothetical protein